jgi:hypothetical protein
MSACQGDNRVDVRDQALIQLFAASVFWISTLTGLPGVIPGLYDGTGSVAIIDVFYWTPQGGSSDLLP